ncbi:MAG TPA: hypothetical protein VF745_07245 [Steroidobacteraceae bacterium]
MPSLETDPQRRRELLRDLQHTATGPARACEYRLASCIIAGLRLAAAREPVPA